MTKSNQTENREYFFCYTKELSDHLRRKGFKFITVAQDPKTKRLYSLYYITEDLHKAIQDFKNK